MSIELMTAVWKTSIGPATKRLVLLALADSANDEGSCFLLISTLARKSGAGESTVQRVLAEMVDEGLLRKEARPGRSTIFHLDRQAIMGSRIETPHSEGVSNRDPQGSQIETRGSQIETHNLPLTTKEEPKDGAAAPAKDASDDEDSGMLPGMPADPPPPPKQRSSADVVASFVDAYTAAKAVAPPKGTISKVAGTAKRLVDGGADFEALLLAAAELGATTFTNLETQYERVLTARAKKTPRPDSETEIRAWLNEQWRRGTIKEICARTGLYYQVPDVPDETPPDLDVWARERKQQWIKEHADDILTKLSRKAAHR
jgi:hypothetical protein